MGPYCEKNALDVAALQSDDLKPLEREHLTVGLVLELWKKKDAVKQMQRWITALTPVELQKYLRGVTSQNLNKACNDLLKKSQQLVRNKKKEELELLKQSLFHLPGSNAPMAREQLTPKSKAIAELKDGNRVLKRSVSKILSFNERLMDEQDALITDQAALEEEYFSTVEHMRMFKMALSKPNGLMQLSCALLRIFQMGLMQLLMWSTSSNMTLTKMKMNGQCHYLMT